MDTTLQLDDGRTVKLRVRSPESYTPNLFNTNQGQERGKAALDDSLQKSGFHRGIVVARDDQVVNGNHAYQSASELGVVKSWIEIEVEGDVGVVTKRLDWETAQDPKAIVAAIADNRVSELNFSIDTEAFQQALDVLAEVGLELPDTLYTEAELNETIAALGGDEDYQGLTDEDEIPDEEQAETRVKRGEVWQLGRHRIMCGDSTCKADVERLMDGTIAAISLLWADPPYGMRLDADFSKMGKGIPEIGVKRSKGYENVIGDHDDFDPSILMAEFDFVEEQFWWGFDYYAERILGRVEGSVIVWDKRVLEQLDPRMGSSFELCWSKSKHKREIARVQWSGYFGTEQEHDRKRCHPTQKPVLLCEWFLEKYSQEKALIFDPFSGSGSALIACEKTDRTCYGMELSEKYCDVILQRFQDFTGVEPQKVTNDRLNIDEVK